jgi:hypothetical protein
MKEKLLEYIAIAENATNTIPRSSCGESIHLHEIKDLYRNAVTSESQSTQLENRKSEAKEELTFFMYFANVKMKKKIWILLHGIRA